MKVTVNKNGYRISFSTEKDIDSYKLSYIIKSINDTLDKVINSDKTQDVKEDIVKAKDNPKVLSFTKEENKEDNKEAQIIERPIFRDRLPNTSVVDVSELSIKQAVTENALVRCPVCGQSHCLSVSNGTKNFYLMRKNYKTNEFETIGSWDNFDDFNKACCKEDTDKKLYYEDLQKAKAVKDDGDFVVNNDTEIFCPVCNKSDNFLSWKNAWEFPLNYFETEQLCDACGGEVVVKPGRKKQDSVYECDCCKLVQHRKVIQ